MNAVEEHLSKSSLEEDEVLEEKPSTSQDQDEAGRAIADEGMVAGASDKTADGETAYQRILDFNYTEPSKNVTSWTRRYLSPTSFPSPLTFQDRHVDPGLILKRVRLMPSLLHDLSANHDAEMQKFRDNGYHFDGSFNAPWYSKGPLGYSREVFKRYRYNLGESCSSIASRCAVHPSTPGSILQMYQKPYKESEDEDRYHTEGALKLLCTVKPKFAKSLDANLARMLKRQVDTDPTLAIWEIFSMSDTAENLLKAIETSSDPFPWESPKVTGYTPAHLSKSRLHPDANAMPWSISSPSDESRSISELSEASSTASPPDGHLVSLLEPRSDEEKDPGSRVNPCLQHAWARATYHDSTFIVFTCGTLERICIRHRASQTLYVSELIDTTKGKDPTYGKIHLGLHLAILQDAMARMRQLHVSRSAKRKEREEKSEDVKRQKVSPTEHQKKPDVGDSKDVSKETNKPEVKVDCSKPMEAVISAVHEQKLEVSSDEEIDREASSRNLFLVHLNDNIHRSPAPASFIRIGKSLAPKIVPNLYGFNERADGYSPAQYATIKLDNHVGGGAVGVVYRGTLELKDAIDGTPLSKPIVVKLAFSNWQKRRMRHEYTIYTHLASKEEVEGVVLVHGLFRDAEYGYLALVLNDAGTSLRIRESIRMKEWGTPLKTTAEERDAYARVLTSIHQAGVHHRDIRGYNLTITSAGKVFFIDFDRAKLNPDKWQRTNEHSRLRCLLAGADETAGRTPGSSEWSSESSD